jgi:hypothetical protein
MSKRKGYCEICGTEIEVRICCNSFDCGCGGLPIDPPVCSSECYDKLMNNNKPEKLGIIDKIIAFNLHKK